MNKTLQYVSVKKNPELQPESLKFNGNTFFNLFLGDLDGKMTSMEFKREETRKQSEIVQRDDNLFTFDTACSTTRKMFEKLSSG